MAKETDVVQVMKMYPQHFGSLGKEIRISPKAKVDILAPGAEIKYNIQAVSCIIDIGGNHIAHLIMDVATWDALNANEKVTIETLNEFKDKVFKK